MNKEKKPRMRGYWKLFIVINPIAGKLLSSRAHVLFGFTVQRYKKYLSPEIWNTT
jgi:hypothetical protein